MNLLKFHRQSSSTEASVDETSTNATIKICVKVMTGELISFECGIDETLLDLKQKIQSIDASLSVGRQRLFDISSQMNEKCDDMWLSNAESQCRDEALCSEPSSFACDERCDDRKELRGDDNRLLSLLKSDGDDDEAMILMLLMSSDSMVRHIVMIVVIVVVI